MMSYNTPMSIHYELQGTQPLYPKIFWNRPTNKNRAGRLLIVGGHKHEFSGVQAIYQVAEAAGSGYVQAAMPDTLRPLVGGGEFGYFLPATVSGSLGRAALGELLHLASEYDAVVLGANLTNNAETAILVESLIQKSDQPLIITEETIDILKFHADFITGNPHALVVTTMKGLFGLANNQHIPLAIKPNSGVLGKLEILQQLVDISRCSYVVFDKDIMVASAGKLSLTPLQVELTSQPTIAIGLAGTFWLQQRSQPFEALTGTAYVLSRLKADQLSSSTKIDQALSGILDQLDE